MSTFSTVIFYIILLNLFILSSLKAQTVVNDSIEYKIELQLNSSYHHSSTKNCTVEWNCIDANKLKSKITFHNDQWFYFTTTNSGKYYLNIKNQTCKDSRGLQLLVIQGIPCIPESYKYMELKSYLSLNDIYYEVKNLEEKHTYLICLDGLLGDNCDFEISVSTEPPGFALKTLPSTIEAKISKSQDLVTLSWKNETSSEKAMDFFQVYKKHGNHNYNKLAKYTVRKYSHASEQETFTHIDTLNGYGAFQYQIIGFRDEEKYLIKTFDLTHFPKDEQKAENIFSYKSTFKGKGNIRFSISDYYSGKLLSTVILENKKGKTFQLDLSRLIKKGITHFRIEAIYNDDRNSKVSNIFKIEQ